MTFFLSIIKFFKIEIDFCIETNLNFGNKVASNSSEVDSSFLMNIFVKNLIH